MKAAQESVNYANIRRDRKVARIQERPNVQMKVGKL